MNAAEAIMLSSIITFPIGFGLGFVLRRAEYPLWVAAVAAACTGIICYFFVRAGGL